MSKMKLRGVTSVLAAGVATSLVWLVGATGEEPPLEAVPAAAAVLQAPPAPGPDRDLSSVREAFGEEFADPLGVDTLVEELPGGWLPGDEFLTFDPYNAPTPEVIQPDGTTDAAVVVPLPTAPATIATTTVESVGEEEDGALLSRPVKGRGTSRFGMRFHPILRVYKLHTGQDWAAPCGSPVGAAAAGTVVRTGWAGGNGVQVKIDHGTLGGHRVVTTYNHLSSVGVKVGQQVKALEGVGRVGSTGYSTGCHLHFEVIVNGQFTDPVPWLNGQPSVVDLTKMDNLIIPTLPGSPQPTLPSLSPSPQPTLPTLPVSPDPSGSPIPSVSPTPSVTPGSPSPSVTPGSPSPSPSPSVTPSLPGSGSPTPSEPTPSEPTPSEPTPSDVPTETPSQVPDPTSSPAPSPPESSPPPTSEPPAPEPDPTTPPPSEPEAPLSSPADPAPAPTESSGPTATQPDPTQSATTAQAPPPAASPSSQG